MRLPAGRKQKEKTKRGREYAAFLLEKISQYQKENAVISFKVDKSVPLEKSARVYVWKDGVRIA